VVRAPGAAVIMNFTDKELGLISDSITWELELVLPSECARAQMLRELQSRIESYRCETRKGSV